MSLKVGQPAPEPRVYRCSSCGTMTALLKDEKAAPCAHCEGINQYSWVPTRYSLLLRTRNVAEEVKHRSTIMDKMTDWIGMFTGNLWFVYVHILWFAIWIWYNTTAANPFDPFPFGFLTLIVSLEAIMLATFILMAQNRQVEVSDVRGELDYNVNVKSEKMLVEVSKTLNELHRHFLGKKRPKK